jgi:predicted TIM-barrel fold metal-dependent hydrolase
MSFGLGRIAAAQINRGFMTPEGDVRLEGKVYRIYHKPANAPVAEACRRYPDRFLGWIFLNPRNNPGVLDELEHWRSHPGMFGIKLHPHWHEYRTELLGPLLARAQELRMPVLIHLGFGKRGDFRAMSRDFPALTLICAHAGFPAYQDLWDFGRSNRNVFVDLSSPYIDEKMARDAVRVLGPDQCLYGTDAPYGFHEEDRTYDYKEILGWVERMPVSSEQRDRILGGNFQRILDHGGQPV